jgi:hypothetical protein
VERVLAVDDELHTGVLEIDGDTKAEVHIVDAVEISLGLAVEGLVKDVLAGVADAGDELAVVEIGLGADSGGDEGTSVEEVNGVGD